MQLLLISVLPVPRAKEKETSLRRPVKSSDSVGRPDNEFFDCRFCESSPAMSSNVIGSPRSTLRFNASIADPTLSRGQHPLPHLRHRRILLASQSQRTLQDETRLTAACSTSATCPIPSPSTSTPAPDLDPGLDPHLLALCFAAGLPMRPGGLKARPLPWRRRPPRTRCPRLSIRKFCFASVFAHYGRSKSPATASCSSSSLFSA